jgi:diaminopimelate decarboxylase
VPRLLAQARVASMNNPPWWQRDDLCYREGRLHLGTTDLQRFVHSSGTPCFVYSEQRVRANLERLQHALLRHGVRAAFYYAIKANRFAPLLGAMRQWGLCGIDACSPGELLLALQSGFAEEQISYTGTSVSNADIEVLRRHPGVHVNCDALSTIRRLGERCPGRSIGIRINPRVGAGYNEGLRYAGEKASKFGIYQDRFEEALALAAHYGMRVCQLHFHFGSGYLNAELPQLQQALHNTSWFLERCPDIDTLDIGGGMGVALEPHRQALDVDAWAALIAGHAQQHGLRIHVEPGDYLVKDAGALLVQVNSVEEKGGTLFVGVDAGFNLQNLAAYYKTPFIAAPLSWRTDAPLRSVSVAGNINEAIDLLAEDVLLPVPEEGDYLALLNTGGYGAAASSNHCMRGQFVEYLI